MMSKGAMAGTKGRSPDNRRSMGLSGSRNKAWRIYQPPYKSHKDGPTLRRSTWRVEYRHNRIVRRFDGFKDEEKAKSFAEEIDSLVECRNHKFAPGVAQRKWFKGQPLKIRERLADMGLFSQPEVDETKPIGKLLKDFEPILRENGCAAMQFKINKSRLNMIIGGAHIEHWQDFNKSNILAYLMTRFDQGMSKQTYKHYVQLAKRFGRWLQKELALERMPVEDLKPMPIKRDRDQKHPHRALSKDERSKLLETTKEGPKRHGLTGYERYMLYKTAMLTGLRRNELRGLKVSSFKIKSLKVEVPGTETNAGRSLFRR